MPNGQAIIEQTANAYISQGVLGATIILLLILLAVAGAVIRRLYNQGLAREADALKNVERLVVALEASKDANERFEAALQSLRATLDTRGQAVADLSHQVEIVAEKVQHGFGNISAALEGFLRLIDRDRDRDRGRP